MIQANCCRLWLPKLYSNNNLRKQLFENMNKYLLAKLIDAHSKRSQLLKSDYKKCKLPILWMLTERIAFAWINVFKFYLKNRSLKPDEFEFFVLKMVLRSRHDALKISGIEILLNNQIKSVNIFFKLSFFLTFFIVFF